MSVVCSWNEIQERVGFFHFNLHVVLAGIIGVFLALDLFLFYFFWELMLVPMYFLIGIWGHENRVYAAIKFFIFTQASGLFMLLAILGLYFIHGQSTGIYTFDYSELLGTSDAAVHGHVADARFLHRLCGQAAGRAAAHLAARRPHRSTDGRKCDPCRPAAQDRSLRPAAFR